MKVIPVSSPHNITQPITGASTQSSTQARERTIAAIEALRNPVPVDANNVSPEEIKAVTPPTKTPEQVFQPDAKIVSTEESTPTQEVTEKPQQDPALARQFAQLARQERQLRLKAQQQERAWQEREASLKSREAELTAKDNTYRNDYIQKARLKQDALGTLEAEGITTYDELTQRAISRQPVDPLLQSQVQKLEAKIAQLEQAASDNQKSYQEQQSQAYQSAIKQIIVDAKDLVKNDPEFEAIRATGTVRDVVDRIKEVHAKSRKILSVEEAARQIEQEYVEQAEKLTSISKIKQRMEKSNASAATSNQKTQAPQQTQPSMKTLTNAQSSTRPLSARERAMLAFKGELKS